MVGRSVHVLRLRLTGHHPDDVVPGPVRGRPARDHHSQATFPAGPVTVYPKGLLPTQVIHGVSYQESDQTEHTALVPT